MDFRGRLFIIILLVIAITSTILLYINKKDNLYDVSATNYKRGVTPEVDKAIDQAQLIYRQKRATRVDFSNGPCLTNDLMPNWVADLVHVPRTSIDDLPQNECSAYLGGRAAHFVELDLDGNLVRVH